MFRSLPSLFAAAGLVVTAASADEPAHDVVVYGGTSGGVTAAVQAARSGRSVVLISPTPHLGGMTSSGLGWTDLGDPEILGGLSREFFTAVYQHYQDDAAWSWEGKNLAMGGQNGPAFNATLGIASVFEPKVAEAIFDDLVSTAGVTVAYGRLDLEAGVLKNGAAISALRLEDGRVFPGGMFIDASYEGDLLPGAGVEFIIGRESNATYGETYNGIQTVRATKNQLPAGIDPYLTPGDAGSGLIRGVSDEPAGPDGGGDDRLQAYCFRMVLTDVAANRVSVPQPEGYDEADYELLFRAIEAGQTSGFFKLSMMPNRKTDSNNSGGISTDFIGRNYGDGWSWATLDHDQRDALAKAHENWQRGLLWTLQNHPRVPASIRNAYASWGLPADEFTDNDHWPWQIYVREARRMVSDFVMTEDYCRGIKLAADAIALGAYAMDSHHVRRQVVGGQVRNEGDVQISLGTPYPIGYRAIVPKRAECTNLLVPWSLSASHTAFGSIRMEPVFMALGQSAALAADLALDDGVAVQDVGYGKLRSALIAAGQALGDPVAPAPQTVVDDADPAVVTTGEWLESQSTGGYAGTGYLHDDNTGKGDKSVLFPLPSAPAGHQRVYLRWTSHANRASNVQVEIVHGGETTVQSIDERNNGGRWMLLGIFPFSGGEGEGVRISNAGTNGYVVADAAGFTPVGENDDSDGDGMSDLREAELGLDPDISNASLFEGVRAHPGYFGLHAPSEIQDLTLTSPRMEDGGLRFDLRDVDGVLESFQRTVDTAGGRAFFRASLGGETAGFLSELAAGANLTVVAYGTSLTANGAWVNRLRDWLAASYPGRVTVINSGLSGKNSAEGVARLQEKVLDHQPDVLFVEFAMNDAFRYSDGTPSLSVDDARANLAAIVDAVQAQNPDCEVVLQTMNCVWDSPAGSNLSATLRPELDQYYEMYRSFAADRSLLLIDHEPAWLDLRENDRPAYEAAVPDGVHPTAAALDAHMVPFLKWKLSGGKPLP
ncbi:FAD-dependent oxidoreductase [Haloferula sargassicola]|uniref:FAD dependent oxidoreductase n=1 Tax=Haloferula sargassicola TaxID=490096 RepID=A0ABP9UR27_9BACT